MKGCIFESHARFTEGSHSWLVRMARAEDLSLVHGAIKHLWKSLLSGITCDLSSEDSDGFNNFEDI
jgi:hypothetical protein